MVGSPSLSVLKRTTVIWVGSVSGFVPVAMAPPSPVRLNAESVTDSVPILLKTPLRHLGGEQPSSPSAIAYGRQQWDHSPRDLVLPPSSPGEDSPAASPPGVSVRFRSLVTIASRGSVNRSVANCLPTIFDIPVRCPLSPLTSSFSEPLEEAGSVNVIPHIQAGRPDKLVSWVETLMTL